MLRSSLAMNRRQLLGAAVVHATLGLPWKALAHAFPAQSTYFAFRQVTPTEIKTCICDRHALTRSKICRAIVERKLAEGLLPVHISGESALEIYPLQRTIFREALSVLWGVPTSDIGLRYGRYFVGELDFANRDAFRQPSTDLATTARFLNGGHYGMHERMLVIWAAIRLDQPVAV